MLAGLSGGVCVTVNPLVRLGSHIYNSTLCVCSGRCSSVTSATPAIVDRQDESALCPVTRDTCQDTQDCLAQCLQAGFEFIGSFGYESAFCMRLDPLLRIGKQDELTLPLVVSSSHKFSRSSRSSETSRKLAFSYFHPRKIPMRTRARTGFDLHITISKHPSNFRFQLMLLSWTT